MKIYSSAILIFIGLFAFTVSSYDQAILKKYFNCDKDSFCSPDSTQVFKIWQVFSLLSLVLLTGIVSLVVKQALLRRKYSRLLPGTKHRFLDVLGNLSELRPKEKFRNGFSLSVFILQVTSAFCQLFKDEQIVCLWLSYAPFIFIKKAEAAKVLLTEPEHLEKGWSYNWFYYWFGTGILTSSVPKWKSRRKLLRPAFHNETLESFMPIYNKHAHILVNCLRKGSTKDSTAIEMPIALCTLDIICETIMGATINAQINNDCQYVQSVIRASEIFMERPLNCLYWLNPIFSFTKMGKENDQLIKYIRNFTLSIIQEKKRKFLSGDKNVGIEANRMTMMDILLEHHIKMKDLTEEDIREEIDTFAFEGHDTLFVGICWTLYLIGLHIDVQKRLHDEMDKVFGDDNQRHATLEDLKDMKYLNCVIKESQRLYPPVPIIARGITENTSICGYPIPKGSQCLLHIHNLHRDETWFPEPEKFDPDRFLPENSKNRHQYAYIPFSAGPRNCIGQKFAEMEFKIITSTILRNYTLESLNQRDELPPKTQLMLKSAVPIRIKIRPRKINDYSKEMI